MDFESIYTRYAPYVATIGLRLLGRNEEVDDLVQDVFFTAHRKMHQLRDPAAVKPWLATTAVRLAQRRLRMRQLRRFVGLDRWDGYATLPAPQAPPEVRSMVSSLFRHLDRLSPDVRIAWTLRHLEGEDLQHIATVCGCSPRTIKRRLQRARVALKEVWDED